jgi:hypothetical protein
MLSPSILSIFPAVFALLGIYNLFMGYKRLREARTQGQKIAWYKQINILTGYEYLLLSIVFVISLNYRSIPKDLQIIVIPLYFVVLASSAILAGFVIKQAISNSRKPKVVAAPQRAAFSTGATMVNESDNHLTPEERAAKLQRKRERRQKAASARRRRAGKA